MILEISSPNLSQRGSGFFENLTKSCGLHTIVAILSRFAYKTICLLHIYPSDIFEISNFFTFTQFAKYLSKVLVKDEYLEHFVKK